MQEFRGFMQTKTDTKVVIDSSPKDDLLRINFNIRCAMWAKLWRSVYSTELHRADMYPIEARVAEHASTPH